MRFELPVCTRCCCCLPLRYGLIVWGYVKLITSCLALALVSVLIKQSVILVESEEEAYRVPPANLVMICCAGAVAVIDLILTIGYIIGCHKKNVRWLQIYYYYSIILVALTIVFDIYCLGLASYLMYQYNPDADSHVVMKIVMYEMMDTMAQIANVGFQIYILLLVRSEILKLDPSTQFSFVNLASEAESNQDALNTNTRQETQKTNNGVDNDEEIRIYV